MSESTTTIPLVFIHGIKGAYLVDQHDRTVFLSFWQAIGLSSPNLALPMEWEDVADGDLNYHRQKRDNIKAGGVLESVGGVQIYGPFMREMRATSHRTGRPFYAYTYDWRRDNNETAEKFSQFLKEIRAKHNSKVQVIAHSMGGLVTLGALHLPNMEGVVHSIMYAGVPFRTGLGFLFDLMEGSSNGYNKYILKPEVLATFPSLYAFFPRENEPKIINHKGEMVPVDFYTADPWVKNKLGIFHVTEPTPQQYEHLKRCCAQAAKFREHIKAREDINYPPTIILCSHSHPTLHRVTLTAEGKYDFGAAPRVLGDNRVVDATPDGIPYNEIVETTMGHSELLNDLPLVHHIIEKLLAL